MKHAALGIIIGVLATMAFGQTNGGDGTTTEPEPLSPLDFARAAMEPRMKRLDRLETQLSTLVTTNEAQLDATENQTVQLTRIADALEGLDGQVEVRIESFAPGRRQSN